MLEITPEKMTIVFLNTTITLTPETIESVSIDNVKKIITIETEDSTMINIKFESIQEGTRMNYEIVHFALRGKFDGYED